MFVRGSERGRKESCDVNPPPAKGEQEPGGFSTLWQAC